MQRLDRTYISVGLLWLVLGMIYGAWLGASHQYNFANSHAHMNLLGFVTSVLFGLIYWAFPALRQARLALWQLVIYELGVLLLVIGKVLVDRDGTETLFLQFGAVLAIVGAAVMLYMFATDRSAA